MGQLDIFVAQSAAADRRRELKQELRRRGTAGAGRTGTTVVRHHRRPTLLARLGLVHQPVG